jgi:hypothetical protein
VAVFRKDEGRLAQLVEHLAYTERVGGSNPSPPTIRALLGAAFLWGLAFAVGLAPGAARADPDSMTFHVAPLEAPGCAARCPHVIVADGVIESSTPQTFVDFLKSTSDDRSLKRIVFFNSRGGNVVASMVFGHILRELRVAGIVGRFDGGAGSGPFVGECLSACVYAMMGAVRRVAPAGSEVALHRMSIVENEGGGWGGPAHVTRSFADKPMVSILRRYARRMGVSSGLVSLAESLPPDAVHVLTPEEMRRFSFATGRF